MKFDKLLEIVEKGKVRLFGHVARMKGTLTKTHIAG